MQSDKNVVTLHVEWSTTLNNLLHKDVNVRCDACGPRVYVINVVVGLYHVTLRNFVYIGTLLVVSGNIIIIFIFAQSNSETDRKSVPVIKLQQIIHQITITFMSNCSKLPVKFKFITVIYISNYSKLNVKQ